MRLAFLWLLLLSTTVASAQEPALLQSWGTVGTGSGEWVDPLRFTGVANLAGGADEVLVVDRASGRVQRFADDGTLLLEWDVATTELVDPVAVASRERVPLFDDSVFYVLDAGADAVLVFRHDGPFVRSWPVTPFDDGDIAVAGFEGDVGVVLTDRHVVEIYDDAGVRRARVGDLDTPGSTSGRFASPRSIASANGGLSWVVADTGNDRIVMVERDLGVVDLFGSPGTGDDRFDAPHGIVVDCRWTVLVADRGNRRIQRVALGIEGVPGGLGFVGGLGPWFEGEGLDFVDVGFATTTLVVVGKDDGSTVASDGEKVGSVGDFFALGAGPGAMRRYEGPCCPTGGFAPEVTVTTEGGDLRVSPAGTGPTLAAIGATVEIVLEDSCGDPIAGFPFQDIALDDDGSGSLNVCPGGSVADANTDVDGRTTISGALFAGGAAESGLYVYVAGSRFGDALPIRAVGPDVNADRIVNVSDVGTFVTDFRSGTSPYRSDMNFDGVIDLTDVGLFATHVGDVCP